MANVQPSCTDGEGLSGAGGDPHVNLPGAERCRMTCNDGAVVDVGSTGVGAGAGQRSLPRAFMLSLMRRHVSVSVRQIGITIVEPTDQRAIPAAVINRASTSQAVDGLTAAVEIQRAACMPQRHPGYRRWRCPRRASGHRH